MSIGQFRRLRGNVIGMGYVHNVHPRRHRSCQVPAMDGGVAENNPRQTTGSLVHRGDRIHDAASDRGWAQGSFVDDIQLAELDRSTAPSHFVAGDELHVRRLVPRIVSKLDEMWPFGGGLPKKSTTHQGQHLIDELLLVTPTTVVIQGHECHMGGCGSATHGQQCRRKATASDGTSDESYTLIRYLIDQLHDAQLPWSQGKISTSH